MLAVIVLNWNGGEDLLECLRSVYAQEGCGTEVVVYVPDNASSDGSLEAVGREFPEARLIQNGGNLGFSGGNNPGWRRAAADGAEWVFFLNNDAALGAGCLRRLLEVCRADPTIGAASPRIYRGALGSGGAAPEVWFEKGFCDLENYHMVTHTEASPAELSSAWYETPLCTGCCFLTTTRLLEATGGFDEGFFAYFEDVDLSLKIRARGLRCAVVPGALAWHKEGQSTRKDASPSSVYYVWRNLYYLGRRYTAAAGRKRFLKHYGIRVWLLAVAEARAGRPLRGRTAIQGCWAALRGRTGRRPSTRVGLGSRVAVAALRGLFELKDATRRVGRAWEVGGSRQVVGAAQSADGGASSA